MAIVRGRVLFADGSPASGYLVQACDQDLPSKKPSRTTLSESQTDEHGRYLIEYRPQGFEPGDARSSQLGARQKILPEIVVTVKDEVQRDTQGEAETLAKSRVHFNVEGDLDVDDISLPAVLRRETGPSEYERINRDLEPVLRGMPPEKLTDEDLEFLEGETGWNSRYLGLLRKAAQFRIGTELPTEVFYGLMRGGVPDTLGGLVDQSARTQIQALRRATEPPATIPSALSGRIEEFVRQLQALRALYAASPPDEYGAPPLTKWLSATIESNDVHNRFIERILKHDKNARSFWTELRNDATLRPHVARIQMTLQLRMLTQHDLPLATAILSRHRPNELRDLVKLKQSDWLAAIRQAQRPAESPGNSAQAQRAAGLVGALQLAFPAEASAHAISEMEPRHFDREPSAEDDRSDGTERSRQAERTRDGVARFLLNASGAEVRARGDSFNLATTHIDEFAGRHQALFAGIDDADRTKVVREVKRVQRLFRISTSPETLTALLQMPHASAYAIARVPRRAFLTEHGAVLGGEDEAASIHDRAVAESTARLELAMQMSQFLNEPLPRGIGG